MKTPDFKSLEPCPSCTADMQERQVVCLNCGYNLETGQFLARESGPPPVAKSKHESEVETDFDSSCQLGHHLVCATVAFFFAVPMIWLVVDASQGRRLEVARVAGLMLLAIWCLSLYRGSALIKWITVAVALLGGYVSAMDFLPVTSRHSVTEIDLVRLAFAVGYIMAALLLIFSRSINDFRFQQQRKEAERVRG